MLCHPLPPHHQANLTTSTPTHHHHHHYHHHLQLTNTAIYNSLQYHNTILLHLTPFLPSSQRTLTITGATPIITSLPLSTSYRVATRHHQHTSFLATPPPHHYATPNHLTRTSRIHFFNLCFKGESLCIFLPFSTVLFNQSPVHVFFLALCSSFLPLLLLLASTFLILSFVFFICSS